jgi:hypothetical protein
MPEQPDPHLSGPAAPLGPAGQRERLRGIAGLADLVAEAESIWRSRAVAAGEPGDQRPGWRTFEDAFPTFYEFTNRPR